MSSIINKNDWYLERRHIYEKLSEYVRDTLLSQINSENIDFLNVTCRVKSADSVAEKIKRKNYNDPENQIKDIAGIRIVTFIERDISKISELIKNSFNVHESESINKTEDLGDDRFGYRSMHFVCDIGESRTVLAECKKFKGMFFEIQVRTALQHAWAEIEHDRGYKLSGELPSHLKRRFHLIAGLLELADREFNSLTEEIETYSLQVKRKTEMGELDIELNTASLVQFLGLKLKEFPGINISNDIIEEDEILELNLFGIRKLIDVEKILYKNLLVKLEDNIPTSYIGFLRDVMMYEDIDRYFKKAWKGKWSGWDRESITVMESKYGKDKIDDLILSNDIDIIDGE